MPFSGETYDPAQDKDRMKTQLGRVFDSMMDGGWHRLADLAATVEGSEAAVSARIRDLRKPRFGAYEVQRRRVVGADGLWEYRLIVDRDPQGRMFA